MRSHQYERMVEEPEPDYTMQFYVFMLVFWPVAILLGLIDFYSVPDYDLRIPMLLLSLAAGWGGVQYYRRWERRKEEAS